MFNLYVSQKLKLDVFTGRIKLDTFLGSLGGSVA